MRLLAWLSMLMLLPACSAPRSASPPAEIKPEPYVRIYGGDTNLVQLQIAIRKFLPARKRGPAIWLMGVSHIGETNYFSRLQQYLDEQSLVLFEGITDHSASRVQHGTEPRNEPRSGSDGALDGGASEPKMASLQTTMASSLGLAFQLDAIDYDRPNFRNSDLTVPELRRLLAERGGGQSFESLLEMMQGGSFFDALVQLGLRFLGSTPKLQALSKLALMQMIGQIQGDPAEIHGLPEDLKQLLEVLISKRNEKVMGDLKSELNPRDPSGSIAIFFGTGHMTDFERRIRGELHYQPVEQHWLTALSIDLQKAGLSRADVEMVRKFVSGGLDQLKTQK